MCLQKVKGQRRKQLFKGATPYSQSSAGVCLAPNQRRELQQRIRREVNSMHRHSPLEKERYLHYFCSDSVLLKAHREWQQLPVSRAFALMISILLLKERYGLSFRQAEDIVRDYCDDCHQGTAAVLDFLCRDKKCKVQDTWMLFHLLEFALMRFGPGGADDVAAVYDIVCLLIRSTSAQALRLKGADYDHFLEVFHFVLDYNVWKATDAMVMAY